MQLDAKPGVLFWTCVFAIDADGHPQCYHPQGSPPGLDHLANAGKPGNWWGVATDNGKSNGIPVVQKQTDPAPGFLVSTTALIDAGWPSSNPLRYVNSGEVPYVVLPSIPKFSSKQTLGDLLMCFNNATGKFCWGIYADIGPSNKIGEGSMALADALGIKSDPKTGGTSKETIAMIYWPSSKVGWPRPMEELELVAYKLFNDWGGYASCKAGLPQFNWDQFPPVPSLPPPPPSPTEIVVTVIAPPGVKVIVQQP
jgi:hypothetical protein